MALWLQRQEAITKRFAYLAWLDCRRSQPTAGPSHSTTGSSSPVASAAPFFVAKAPAFKKVTISNIVQKHQAKHFVPALTAFLKDHFRKSPQPGQHDRFDGYKQIHLTTPANELAGTQISTSTVRANPATPAEG